MHTTEATLSRYPDASGASQGTGMREQTHLAHPCHSDGSSYRSIGTGEEVKFILNSTANYGTDGIGYAFFSYGNVSSIADSANFGYLTLNGVDGIWHRYGSTIDPGQPAPAGNLPSATDLPAACVGGFPCAEKLICSGNLSFPNLRNGSYRAGAGLRLA